MKSTRFTGNKLEVYYLPDGGLWGKDEIPLHSSQTKVNIERKTSVSDAHRWGDNYRYDTIRHQEATIYLYSQGVGRDIPRFVKPGEQGTFAFLYGNRPDTMHSDIVIASFSINFPAEGFEWEAELMTRGELMQGDYIVDRQYAIAQYDMADGTFIEKPLIHQVLLDQLIDNRYHGWQ